jgi:hypothetical protein
MAGRQKCRGVREMPCPLYHVDDVVCSEEDTPLKLRAESQKPTWKFGGCNLHLHDTPFLHLLLIHKIMESITI